MKDEKLKYRISYFRTPEMILISWDKLDAEMADKIPHNYYYTTRAINKETGEVEEKTYLILEPVKKFKKKETVLSLSDSIDIGLDDF